MWTYFGHSAKTLEDIISGKATGGTIQKVLLGMEVGSVIVLAAVIIFLIRRVLKKAMDEKEREESAMLINSTTDSGSIPISTV